MTAHAATSAAPGPVAYASQPAATTPTSGRKMVKTVIARERAWSSGREDIGHDASIFSDPCKNAASLEPRHTTCSMKTGPPNGSSGALLLAQLAQQPHRCRGEARHFAVRPRHQHRPFQRAQ